MVQVGNVRMGMLQRRMLMRMGMGFDDELPRGSLGMRVLMVFVVGVSVVVFERLVVVQVRMPFEEQQDHARAHNRRSGEIRSGEPLAHDGDGSDCADEWRGREERRLARSA